MTHFFLKKPLYRTRLKLLKTQNTCVSIIFDRLMTDETVVVY